MSSEVLGWVFRNSPARGPDRMLHVAMADSARDDGYLSGERNGYGSMAYLQRKCGFPSRQTLTEAVEWLLQHGEILRCRPAERGWGKHNEYLILMGRDPRATAHDLGWPAPTGTTDRSATQTDLSVAPPTTPYDADPTEDQMEGATERDEAHRGVQAAPPADCGEQGTEPVDDPEAPTSAPVCEADRSSEWTGPGPVQDRSTGQHTVLIAPLSEEPQVAHGPDPGRARDAVRPVDDPVEELIGRVARLAPGVRVKLTDRQRAEIAVHLSAWRDPGAGVEALVDVTQASIDRYGVPRTVQAWLGPWLDLAPPAIDLDESVCDEHPLGDLRVPRRVCAMCRTERVAAMVSR